MWPKRSHTLAPLLEMGIFPKSRKIICNNKIQVSFKDINIVVFSETLMNYPDCKIMFTVHTGAYDKQFFSVISQNNKPIY